MTTVKLSPSELVNKLTFNYTQIYFIGLCQGLSGVKEYKRMNLKNLMNETSCSFRFKLAQEYSLDFIFIIVPEQN